MNTKKLAHLYHIVSQDTGGRGMTHLICPDDFQKACQLLGTHDSSSKENNIVLLTGFPCHMDQTIPTETDGPPGTLALARACTTMGHKTTIVTEDYNRPIFEAATLTTNNNNHHLLSYEYISVSSQQQQTSLQLIAQQAGLYIACERAGPARDGHSYTMRGRDMTERNLIASSIDQLVVHTSTTSTTPNSASNNKIPFIAIGDGGNELGMGKVISQIETHIPGGAQIGCVVPADYLIAASVSNWGGYALAAGAALVHAAATFSSDEESTAFLQKCIPTVEEEKDALHRMVQAGCRDGVSGKQEATVDGMPLETSMDILEQIRSVVFSKDLTDL